ncbi:MAG: glycerophosphodiester phosphodiesterase [Bacteroidetes bacterium]|nr:glycerophosphodiester phosphodiesterase [Bacteroidota bacterium]HOA39167.1 glycerophosphodiester phosphodiesterase family protein [Flavihumibacter sp.]
MSRASWLIGLVFFFGCKAPQSTLQPLPSFDWQGHRGARGLMPENTIPAMLRAIDLGVTTLEMDIVMSADGKVVVSHDPFFNYQISTKPDGSLVTKEEAPALNIYKMDYDSVKTYDVGLRAPDGFTRQQSIPAVKPLLSELIDSVEAYAKSKGRPALFYNIEPKTTPITDDKYHPAPAVMAAAFMQILRDKKITDRVLIQSFDTRMLKLIHKHYHDVRVALLIDAQDHRSMKKQFRELHFKPAVYSPWHQLVTPEMIRICHRKKVKIVPWTINNLQRIEQLKKWGVDGIITDYPDLLQQKK